MRACRRFIPAVALVALLTLTGCPFDPYNALIWNRQNALHHTGEIDTGPWFEWWYPKGGRLGRVPRLT